MAGDFSCTSGVCERLSRRLGVQALAGLGALAAAMCALAMAALAALSAATAAFAQGAVLTTLIWSVTAVLAGLGAGLCGRWLFAPDAGPQGVALERRSVGSLHRLIDRVGARFGGVKVHAVWVTGDMNAAVLQRPRWGLVGPMRTHFMIGLPLIHSVSDRQFPAILAHEFGHLVRQRQGLAAWGCHVRAWWFRSMDRCIDDLPMLAGPIERWTANYLEQARLLARIEEFEADQAAAQVVGAGLLGETLVEVALKERFLAEDYWHQILAQNAAEPSRPMRPYHDMGLGMAAGFRRTVHQHALRQSMAAGEDHGDDPHPSLSERLLALGILPDDVVVEEGEAAVCHLSPMLSHLASTFDQAWRAGQRDDDAAMR